MDRRADGRPMKSIRDLTPAQRRAVGMKRFDGKIFWLTETRSSKEAAKREAMQIRSETGGYINARIAKRNGSWGIYTSFSKKFQDANWSEKRDFAMKNTRRRT